MSVLYSYLLILKSLPQLEEGVLIVLEEPVCYLLDAEGILPSFLDVSPVLFIAGEGNI